MTEAKWRSAADPGPMLAFLRGRASDRKLRLFACACCRAVWVSLGHGRSRQAVEVAERYADGLADERALNRAHSLARNAQHRVQQALAGLRPRVRLPDPLPAEVRLALAADAAHVHEPFLIGRLEAIRHDAELSALAPALLRDIFGNPYRPAAFDPRWRTADVIGLARAIYEDRAFGRLPLLGDALMDAGCADEAILAHCRADGPHVRGCWVVDLALGKE